MIGTDDPRRDRLRKDEELKRVRAAVLCVVVPHCLYHSVGVYVGREIIFLCEIIDRHATVSPDDQQRKQIKFGPLFYLYAHYSDKVSRPTTVLSIAGNHVGKEILEVCEVIDIAGEAVDGYKMVTFGHLFLVYSRISDKVKKEIGFFELRL